MPTIRTHAPGFFAITGTKNFAIHSLCEASGSSLSLRKLASRTPVILPFSVNGMISVLLIATFRPEFQSPWIGLPHVTALFLRRLARDESDQLVRGLVRHTVGLSKQLAERVNRLMSR